MREENIFSSSFDKFPAGHSAPLRRRHVKITSIRGWIRERERERQNERERQDPMVPVAEESVRDRFRCVGEKDDGVQVG